MKEWKGYNLLDLILVLSGLITVVVTSVIFKSPWYILINTILGILCVFTQAKGKIVTQFLGILYFSLYSVISYTQKYYGEVILYILMMIPMYIYGVIHWLKNKDVKATDTVLVRSNLSKKEWIVFTLSIVPLTVIVYFILKALDTAEVMISTLSFVTLVPSVYLLSRRCKWNQVAFLINDFIEE